ncbi:MAG TPA: ATP-binding protein, partial [Nitrospirota bacterium]|nr:ATP-binding protein [Nitrospirota bacterium]
NDVVQDTTHFLMASISKSADLEYSLSDDLPAIMAGPQNMQQIVMNLIINASDAIGDDKGTIKVSTGKIRADRKYLDSLHPTGLAEGEYLYIEVSDTGCGMSPETRRRIFEPFYTTKFTGRGLGLSAVFGIVSAHGGAIGLETEEGCGTTFRVLLPLPAEPVEVAAAKPVSEDIWSGKGTILVVDDEKDSLLMAKTVLEGAGYSVLTAEDGSEAIEIYRKNSGTISAVIMDLIMPRVRGDEAAKKIRKIRDDINIILLSGYHEIDLTELTRGPGKTSILGKPYRITKLLTEVQDILKA